MAENLVSGLRHNRLARGFMAAAVAGGVLAVAACGSEPTSEGGSRHSVVKKCDASLAGTVQTYNVDTTAVLYETELDYTDGHYKNMPLVQLYDVRMSNALSQTLVGSPNYHHADVALTAPNPESYSPKDNSGTSDGITWHVTYAKAGWADSKHVDANLAFTCPTNPTAYRDPASQ